MLLPADPNPFVLFVLVMLHVLNSNEFGSLLVCASVGLFSRMVAVGAASATAAAGADLAPAADSLLEVDDDRSPPLPFFVEGIDFRGLAGSR